MANYRADCTDGQIKDGLYRLWKKIRLYWLPNIGQTVQIVMEGQTVLMAKCRPDCTDCDKRPDCTDGQI